MPEQRGGDEMRFINSFDIRVARFQISHRRRDYAGSHRRVVPVPFSSPTLELHDYAWSVIDCSYRLNYPRPPSSLGEMYDPYPNWRAISQFVYFGNFHALRSVD